MWDRSLMGEDARVTALVAAITSGDADAVRELLREDRTLAGARDGDGLPVLLLALFHQQREAADALLEAEPELGVLEAAAAGRAERLRELLDADPAALRQRTPEGFTALGLAAFLGGAGAGARSSSTGPMPTTTPTTRSDDRRARTEHVGLDEHTFAREVRHQQRVGVRISGDVVQLTVIVASFSTSSSSTVSIFSGFGIPGQRVGHDCVRAGRGASGRTRRCPCAR